MKPPSLFILGAPKCATTSLYALLAKHTNIFDAPIKEPGFYTRSDVRADIVEGTPHLQSEQAYLALYAGAAAHEICCDASTSYLRSEGAIDQIASLSKNTKAIAVYRDPVELVSSYHTFLLNEGWETEREIRRAWELQAERRAGKNVPRGARRPKSLLYGDVARLGEQLAYAKECFGERLMIFEMSELTNATGKISDQIQSWLGVPYQDLGQFPHSNTARLPRSAWLSNFVKSPPGPVLKVKNYLKSLVGGSSLGIVRRINVLNEQAIERKLPYDMRLELQRYFRDDVVLLERIVDRRLRELWSWDEYK